MSGKARNDFNLAAQKKGVVQKITGKRDNTEILGKAGGPAVPSSLKPIQKKMQENARQITGQKIHEASTSLSPGKGPSLER